MKNLLIANIKHASLLLIGTHRRRLEQLLCACDPTQPALQCCYCSDATIDVFPLQKMENIVLFSSTEVWSGDCTHILCKAGALQNV